MTQNDQLEKTLRLRNLRETAMKNRRKLAAEIRREIKAEAFGRAVEDLLCLVKSEASIEAVTDAMVRAIDRAR
jgi:hypothetical protein